MSDDRGVKPHQAGPAAFIADPAALGLAGLALATMVLTFVNVGVFDQSVLPVALGLALGAPAE